MSKQTWKAGNMLYPLPAVMVSVTDGEGNDNIITVAWAGTICTNPPMVSISVRPLESLMIMQYVPFLEKHLQEVILLI